MWSWDAVWADIERLRRELDAVGFNDSVLAYPEAHPGRRDNETGAQTADSHGWHVHLAVAKYVPVDLLRACWDRATPNAGFVDIRKIRVRGSKTGGREAARQTARYVAKAISGYVTKEQSNEPGAGTEGAPATPFRTAPERPFNGKRFSVAKGQTIPEVRFTTFVPAALAGELAGVCGFRLFRVWDSPPDWGKGPPISIWNG